MINTENTRRKATDANHHSSAYKIRHLLRVKPNGAMMKWKPSIPVPLNCTATKRWQSVSTANANFSTSNYQNIKKIVYLLMALSAKLKKLRKKKLK